MNASVTHVMYVGLTIAAGAAFAAPAGRSAGTPAVAMSREPPSSDLGCKRPGSQDHPASPGPGEAGGMAWRERVRSMAQPAVQFMLELAAALNRAGEPVALNQASMERIARAYGVEDARVAVLPDMVLAAGGRGTPAALDFAHLDAYGHRLDRTAAIAALQREAEEGAVDPEEGLRRLDAIAAQPHRFGTLGVIGGHMILTIGLALILQPTPQALGMAAVFGALIGWLKVSTRHMQTATVLLPVAAATLVSLLAFWIKPDQTIDGSMRVLIPALVTFLPGGLLTTATLDLAGRRDHQRLEPARGRHDAADPAELRHRRGR